MAPSGQCPLARGARIPPASGHEHGEQFPRERRLAAEAGDGIRPRSFCPACAKAGARWVQADLPRLRTGEPATNLCGLIPVRFLYALWSRRGTEKVPRVVCITLIRCEAADNAQLRTVTGLTKTS